MTKINLQDIGEILQEKARTVSECLGVTKGTGCNATEYEDIIYVTSQKKFWLLPKELADRLSESASLLADKVATDDKTARMQNLETSGLIHCIATPKLESFLSAEEREKYLDADRVMDDIETNRASRAIRMAYYVVLANNTIYNGKLPFTVQEECHPKTIEYVENLYNKLVQQKYRNQEYVSDANREYSKFISAMSPYEKIWNELEQKAKAALKAAGYEMREGVIFTPEQIQIKKAIDNYLKNQEKLQSHEDTSEDNNKNIFEAIAEYRKKAEMLYVDTKEYPMLAVTMGEGLLVHNAFEAYERGKVDELEKTIQSQMECIIELANYGIAVPEFALGSKDPEQGLKQLHYLRSLQVRRQNAASALEKKFEIWYNATGRNIVPPLPIFDNDIEKIAVIDAEIDEIQAKAEQIANNNTPPMLLFWDPKKFEPKEAEWLVKGDMPLREFSRAWSKGGPFLSHISLYDVVSKNTALFDMLNKGSTHIKSLNNDDGLFDAYLTENMAYEIGFQKDWYDHEKATFKAQTFFDYLDNKGWKIKSIETQAQRDEWAKTLNSIIFEEKVQRHIMAFDNSLSASFIRLLGGPKMAQLNFEAKGPEMENLKFGSVQVNLKISPLHGQIDIFDFTYPKPNQAIQISIPYYTYRGERKELDFGHFYLHMRAKAWGFAGVSIMAGAKVALSDDLGVVGIKVVDPATGKESGRTGTGAITEFNLFAGVQAGIKLITELMWRRPANLKNFNAVYEQAIARKTQQPIPTFRTLSKLEVGAAVQAGGALAAGFGIILKDGKLHIAFEFSAAWGVGGKVFTTFEVDYRSIGDLVQIVCKALIDNDMQPLQWVEDDALDAIIKMSVLGVALPTLTYWTFWTVTKLDALYRSIIAEGKGGMVAYYITDPDYSSYFKDWFMVLPPQAVGPLLWTLTRSPGAFEVTKNPTQQPEKYTRDHSTVFQQRAINLCLSWIKERAEGGFSKTNPNNAQKFFEVSVCRMNADGLIDLNENVRNNKYMTNRFDCLQLTMELWRPKSDVDLLDISNQEYLKFERLVKDLGMHIDCYKYDAGEDVYAYPGARRYTYNRKAND